MEETSTQAETVEETPEHTEQAEAQSEHPEWFKANKYNSIEDQAKAFGFLDFRKEKESRSL